MLLACICDKDSLELIGFRGHAPRLAWRDIVVVRRGRLEVQMREPGERAATRMRVNQGRIELDDEY